MRVSALGAVALGLALLSPLGSAQAQNWHGQQGPGSDGHHWHDANQQAGQWHGDHQRSGYRHHDHWHQNHWRHAQWRHAPWGRPGYYHPHPPPRFRSWHYAPPPPPVVYGPPPPAPGIGFFFSFR